MKLSRYYLPTIELTPSVEESIRYGATPVRVGQWLVKNGNKARFLRTGPQGGLFLSYVNGETPDKHTSRMVRAINHYHKASAEKRAKHKAEVVSEYRSTTPFLKRVKEMIL